MSPNCAQKTNSRITNIPPTNETGETPSYSDTDRARFWSKVNITPACWLWQASTNPRNGYGQFAVTRDGWLVSLRTHRVAWELTNGPIPDGKHVLHACDVPACVNPHHLFLGTHKVNMEDAARKGRLHVSRPRRQTISDESVARIFTMRQQGALLQGIADAIGCTKAFVSLVLKGKRRQHPKPRRAASPSCPNAVPPHTEQRSA